MPALGESVTEGTVTRWLKNVGDQVAVDEPLLEVSTDKVDTEIPSPVSGTLLEILVQEDETVPVGADLAVLGDGNAVPEDAAAGFDPRQRREVGAAQAHVGARHRRAACARRARTCARDPGSCTGDAARPRDADRATHRPGSRAERGRGCWRNGRADARPRRIRDRGNDHALAQGRGRRRRHG